MGTTSKSQKSKNKPMALFSPSNKLLSNIYTIMVDLHSFKILTLLTKNAAKFPIPFTEPF